MWNDTVVEAVRAVATPEFDLRAAKLACYPTATLPEKRATIDAILNATKYLPQSERGDVALAIQGAAGKALPDNLMMTDAQLCFLRDAGMEIGAHTRTHPILMKCSPATAESEIAKGRDDLATVLGTPPMLFAYPNGKPGRDYDSTHVDIVRRMGFTAAVSTSWGAARGSEDLFQLPRFTPWSRKSLPFGLRLAQNIAANRPVRV
jgi:peptidoglycan/xylan/chitin deacetylase (PgdA/CDA1 family)